MDLSDLLIFRTVAQKGGITRAARHLHRVQSNVTTRVRNLEDDLGVKLFIREGKRLHLSPAGHILIGFADTLLSLAAQARDAVLDPQPRGVLRLGAMESTAAVRLPAALTAFHRRFPAVALELRTGNPRQLATAILAGELDAALAAEPIADEPFEKVAIYEEPLVIVASARYRSARSARDLPTAMVAFEDGCPHRKRLEDWFAGCGIQPHRTIEMSSYHAILGCVLADMGISLVPRSILSTFPEHRTLTLHKLPRGQDRATTVLFWRKGAGSPKIAAMRDVLQETHGRTARA